MGERWPSLGWCQQRHGEGGGRAADIDRHLITSTNPHKLHSKGLLHFVQSCDNSESHLGSYSNSGSTPRFSAIPLVPGVQRGSGGLSSQKCRVTKPQPRGCPMGGRQRHRQCAPAVALRQPSPRVGPQLNPEQLKEGGGHVSMSVSNECTKLG